MDKVKKKLKPTDGEKQIELTEKQKIFCREYIYDWNATRAAIVAGYSEKTAAVIGCENLIKPNIQEYLKEIQADLAKTAGISRLQVIREHQKLAFSSIAHLHNTWVDRKDFDELSKDQKDCIQEISSRVVSKWVDDKEITTEEVKVKLYDKQKSLDSICKMLGYNEPEEHNLNLNNISGLELPDYLEKKKK